MPRLIKARHRHFFHLDIDSSPASYQLAQHLKQASWKATRFKIRAHFSEENLAFDATAAQQLEYKHLLAALIQRHCPSVMPLTYSINDQNWPLILNHISASEFNPYSRWILKPSMLNNGQHIHIFEGINRIEQFYLGTDRMGGEHVLQHYIDSPHLLKGPQAGHKYSIRMFVVLSTQSGAYLYPEGYFNIALQPYPGNNFVDLKPHLSNEHLHHDQRNVVQIPTVNYELFKPFFPQIKAITSAVIKAFQREQPQAFKVKPAQLGFFGFDFMVDSLEKVWLLEVNHGPCFPVNEQHPLQESFYHGFWTSVLDEFVLPMVTNKTNKKKAHFMALSEAGV